MYEETTMLEALDDSTLLGDEDVVVMAVKELPPFVWRSHAEDSVALSHYGAVATQIREEVKQRISSNVNQEGEIVVETEVMVRWSLTTAEKELIEGKHYWEVELRCTGIRPVHMGISTPGLDPRGYHGNKYNTYDMHCPDSWFMCTNSGSLYGNGEDGSNIRADGFVQGDCVWACCWTLTTAPFASSRMERNTAQATQQEASQAR
jgi:hypothetical protein